MTTNSELRFEEERQAVTFREGDSTEAMWVHRGLGSNSQDLGATEPTARGTDRQ